MNIKIEKNVPFPKNSSKELVEFILSLKEGDSIYLQYDEFNKTIVNNCLASVRVRIQSKGLVVRTLGDTRGRRVWVFKKFENND